MDASRFYIQTSSSEPIYRQIAEQIRRLIAARQLSPGEILPSVREVAARHTINPMTVSRAYGQLEAEGLLLRLRGKGMAVAESSAAPSLTQRLATLDPLLSDLARHCRELDLPADAVIERLSALLGEPVA